eukprot:TRINITY_DN2586_c0_g1_i2.p1 TRINITY_DN2586_c0_g1~~TRINITY_DN2586_c0_g1_i2.p1  ORF type:complete len:185 (-),score=34.33 TRINITY_DN2586_c0_g1_i2:1977-2477(-)
MCASTDVERCEADCTTQTLATQDSCNDDVPGHQHFSNRAQWLRAAVLGANDGLVSTAALLMGVDGGGATHTAVILAGTSGLMAGAFSMALGEYVSVWSQRDAQLADIAKEKAAQAAGPRSQAAELQELADIYVRRGLDAPLAMQVTSCSGTAADLMLKLPLSPIAQ